MFMSSFENLEVCWDSQMNSLELFQSWNNFIAFYVLPHEFPSHNLQELWQMEVPYTILLSNPFTLLFKYYSMIAVCMSTALYPAPQDQSSSEVQNPTIATLVSSLWLPLSRPAAQLSCIIYMLLHSVRYNIYIFIFRCHQIFTRVTWLLSCEVKYLSFES